MRKTLLTAFAAATVLSCGILGNRAEAMSFAKPSQLDVANANTALVQQATVVCGNGGCSPVQTHRIQRRKIHH